MKAIIVKIKKTSSQKVTYKLEIPKNLTKYFRIYWMNVANIFVLPSLSESFGVLQIEAMACGVPVVATRNGESEEIITSEDYGLLYEPGNPDDLAEKILIALEKEWDREKIRKYAEQFTGNNIAKKVVEVYENILGGGC